MIPAEILALAAPLCIALGGMFSAELTGRISVSTITRWRVMAPIPFLALVATVLGGWATVQPTHLPYLILSGIIGMVVADAAFSASIFAIGARLATLVFSLNAPIAALLAFLLLGESVSVGKIFGIALVFGGIVIAVAYRPAAPGAGDVKLNGRMLLRGLSLGALSAAAQACSMIAARPVMAQSINAAAAMSIRLAAAAVILGTVAVLCRGSEKPAAHPTRYLIYSALGAVIGIGMGVTFVFAGLQTGNVATVATLASLTPVAVLPLVWIRTGMAPRWQAWIGALTAFSGAALIANS
ncbi:hypothetical protein AA309_04470 [Microvirga vignae]|uniref:EamA domain-containing protein n=1 Tax=Microvirga vignae TaxID=1225564 RepID=A0A0H1RG84_9HYPH|nr:DMT family transporter [Microvirga vignae]KLK94218.1 hypothetical protein AA309_04470 [Microvirga vignae]